MVTASHCAPTRSPPALSQSRPHPLRGANAHPNRIGLQHTSLAAPSPAGSMTPKVHALIKSADVILPCYVCEVVKGCMPLCTPQHVRHAPCESTRQQSAQGRDPLSCHNTVQSASFHQADLVCAQHQATALLRHSDTKSSELEACLRHTWSMQSPDGHAGVPQVLVHTIVAQKALMGANGH